MNTNNEQKNNEIEEAKFVAGFFDSYKKLVLPNEESFKLFIKNGLTNTESVESPIASSIRSPYSIISIFSQMKYRVAILAVFVLMFAFAGKNLITPSSPTPMLARSEVEQTLARIDTQTETEAYAVKATIPSATPKTGAQKPSKKVPDTKLYTATPTGATSASADVNTLINNDYANEL